MTVQERGSPMTRRLLYGVHIYCWWLTLSIECSYQMGITIIINLLTRINLAQHAFSNIIAVCNSLLSNIFTAFNRNISNCFEILLFQIDESTRDHYSAFQKSADHYILLSRCQCRHLCCMVLNHTV